MSSNVKMVGEFFDDMKTFDVTDLGMAAKFLEGNIEYETAFGFSMIHK
jgi:hypothetical protein